MAMVTVGSDVEMCNKGMMRLYSGHADDGEAVDIGSHPPPLNSIKNSQH